MIIIVSAVMIFGNRRFRKDRVRLERTQWDIDEEGLSANSQIVSARIPWGDLFRWKESGEMILLFQSQMDFHVFPRRFFSEEGWRRLRELAGRNVKKVRLL